MDSSSLRLRRVLSHDLKESAELQQLLSLASFQQMSICKREPFLNTFFGRIKLVS